MRRALCVGIDQYTFGSLRGCVADAERMAEILAKHEDGGPNFECRKMVAPAGGLNTIVTRTTLKQAIEQLLKDKAEVALLHFSGQRPLFKAHVSTVVPLRRCKAPIDISILRALPTLFPVPAEDLLLAPEFETTCEKKDDAKNVVYCKLQALNRVYLVVTVGVAHMYEAAMQSKACRLTAAGRYYWRLAKDNRI